MTASQQKRRDLHALLTAEHAALEKRYEEIQSAFHANAREEVVALWTSFEAALLEHMKLEEELILPELAHVDPDAVAEIEAEHGRLRTLLAELGVGVDLHRTREDNVTGLLGVLKAHGQREERLLYRWAEENLSAAPRRRLLERLFSRAAA